MPAALVEKNSATIEAYTLEILVNRNAHDRSNLRERSTRAIPRENPQWISGPHFPPGKIVKI